MNLRLLALLLCFFTVIVFAGCGCGGKLTPTTQTTNTNIEFAAGENSSTNGGGGQTQQNNNQVQIQTQNQTQNQIQTQEANTTNVQIQQTHQIQVTVNNQIQTQQIQVTANNQTQMVVIESNQVQAQTNAQIQVKNETIYMELNGTSKKIIVMPDQAVEMVREQSKNRPQTFLFINLTSYQNKPVYDISVKEQKNFLILFPMELEKQYVINAQTGEIVKQTGPWWEIFTV